MPRKKKPSRKASEIPPGVREILETGDLGEYGSDWNLFQCRWRKEKTREYWEAHRDEILPSWVERFPGTRPWGWWQVEAPLPRQEIGHDPPTEWTLGDVYVRGLPYDCDPPPYDQLDSYESEATYLSRQGLLLKGEKKRLKKKDFVPERA